MEILWYYHKPNHNAVNERVETLNLPHGHKVKHGYKQPMQQRLVKTYLCGAMGTTVPLLTVLCKIVV